MKTLLVHIALYIRSCPSVPTLPHFGAPPYYSASCYLCFSILLLRHSTTGIIIPSMITKEKEKTLLSNDPLQKNPKVKASRSSCSPFGSPPFSAADYYCSSDRFINRGIAETLDPVKRRNSRQRMPAGQHQVNSNKLQYILYSTVT